MIKRLMALAVLSAAAGAASAAYSLSPYQNFVTGSSADTVAVGDVNGDGRDDVVLTTTSYFDEENDYKVFVFFQKHDGTLEAPRKYSYQGYANRNGLALADLDRDGRMDIIVGHGAGITILRWGALHGKMAMRSRLHAGGKPADDVAVADIDRDGFLDVFGQSWGDGAIVYFGDGRGSIARTVSLSTPADGYNDLEAGDLNSDGHDDIVVLSGQGQTHAYVYYNDGSDDLSAPLDLDPNPGEFVTIGALGIGDFNADGRNDLVVMRDRTELSMFRQNATGELDPAVVVETDWDPNAILGHDMDGDGREDLVIQHGSGPVGIYLQGPNGLTPEAVSPGLYATWYNTQGLAAGDINGDGCGDVVSANYNYGLVVHLGGSCAPRADLAVNLGLRPSVVALRLDNFGDAAAAGLEITVELSVASGNLGIGELPEECSLQSQAMRTATLRCQGSALADGTSRTMLIPIAIGGGDRRNVLTASATGVTTSPERRLDNNHAHRQLRLWPALTAASVRTQTQSRQPSGR